MDGEGGGLCFPRGLGPLDRINSGGLIREKLQTHRAHVYAHGDLSPASEEGLGSGPEDRRSRSPGCFWGRR
ncbi:hypothetical protein Tco_0794148 [Tanacetum coccineum]